MPCRNDWEVFEQHVSIVSQLTKDSAQLQANGIDTVLRTSQTYRRTNQGCLRRIPDLDIYLEGSKRNEN
jgi:hypothetical protein